MTTFPFELASFEAIIVYGPLCTPTSTTTLPTLGVKRVVL